MPFLEGHLSALHSRLTKQSRIFRKPLATQTDQTPIWQYLRNVKYQPWSCIGWVVIFLLYIPRVSCLSCYPALLSTIFTCPLMNTCFLKRRPQLLRVRGQCLETLLVFCFCDLFIKHFRVVTIYNRAAHIYTIIK